MAKELILKITLDDSWEAYIPDDVEKIKQILRPGLEGVEVELVIPERDE